MNNSYSIQDNNMFPIILNYFGREGLQFMQTLNDEEQEKCKSSMGLFEVLSETFKP